MEVLPSEKSVKLWLCIPVMEFRQKCKFQLNISNIMQTRKKHCNTGCDYHFSTKQIPCRQTEYSSLGCCTSQSYDRLACHQTLPGVGLCYQEAGLGRGFRFTRTRGYKIHQIQSLLWKIDSIYSF